jgi:hypothetical protein
MIAIGAQRCGYGLIVDKGCCQHGGQSRRRRKAEQERATLPGRRPRQAIEPDRRSRERKGDAADPD